VAGLATAFDTTFVTFEHHPDSADGYTSRAELESVLPGVEVITVPGLGPGKRLRQARTLGSRRSWTYGRYALPPFGAALQEAIARRRPAIMHFDDLGVAQFAPLDGPLNVFAPHNVEHRIIRGDTKVSRGMRRLFAEVEWRKLAREEQALWATMPLCVAVSELDAAAMRAAGAARVAVCPNGTDPVDPLPIPHRDPAAPLEVLFLGSANYRPYENGIAWFVREVLPRVQARLPTTFTVVGRPPRRPVSGPGVRYVGPVDAVRPCYARAHVVVVPVFEGSGTRLKLVEALAHGRPAVGTGVGAEGLPIRPGEHFLRADDANAFAAALLDVARWTEDRDARLTELLDRGRDAVKPLFWPAIVQGLVATYRRELEAR
jgi:glycosyltransferase involved in cell wall biosynthesis